MSNISPGTTDLGKQNQGLPSTHIQVVVGRQACDKYFLKDVNGKFMDLGDETTMFGYEEKNCGLFISDLCGLFVQQLELGGQLFETRCGQYKNILNFKRFRIGCDIIQIESGGERGVHVHDGYRWLLIKKLAVTV